MTDLPRAEAEVVEIEAGANRLYVTRFTDPEHGRDVVMLAEDWNEDEHPFGPRGIVAALPAYCIADVAEALHTVGASELPFYTRAALYVQAHLRRWTAHAKLRWYWHVTRRFSDG